MSFIKKHLHKLREGGSSATSTSSESSLPPAKKVDKALNGALAGALSEDVSPGGSGTSTPDSRRRSREVIREERIRRSLDKARAKDEAKKRQSLARMQEEKFLEEGPEHMTKLFKPYSMNMSKYRGENQDRVLFKEINFAAQDGKFITFRARIHTIRRMSAKMTFIVFRQQTITIQGVLHTSATPPDASDSDCVISEQMVRAIEHYQSETIVIVTGRVRKAVQRVKNATIHDYELDVFEVHRTARLTENVPFSVYDAENINRDKEESDEEGDDDTSEAVSETVSEQAVLSQNSLASTRPARSLPTRVRLNNRVVDLRTAPSQAIFRIQSGIGNLFRSYLDDQGFIEIHTPKLQGGATESGASVFQVNYFGRPAFLAQSPQLSKQMCIAADFERVYEIGAVFRAEDSNTPRHLTEYTGLDIEMALEEHYHEALDIIDDMFKHLWKGIYDRYQKEIDIISQYYPQKKVEWLDVTPRIKFADGVKMLIESGWVEEDGSVPSETEDLSTRAEIRLGALVKEKYHTDYYILDKFPASVRPFYTMPDPNDDRFTNSFDIFMRGQEILTGGQRIHDAEFLEKRMKQKGVNPESMPEYMEGFRWGAPPHAGCGIGLERLTYLFLNLGNIRLASLFHRDPKTFPLQPPRLVLRHEEASTIEPPWEKADIDPNSPEAKELQPLTKLIANYGDAANTSWLDERYQVWRHPSTGAAQGYVIHNNFAIAVGEPLCAKSQYSKIVSAFLQYMKEEHKDLKLIWMIVGTGVEEYLGEKFGWRTLACIAEERADPRNDPTQFDSDLARKVRHAEKEGIKFVDWPSDKPVDQEIQDKINARVKDWQKNRKGTQVHLTEIRPWIDWEHRRYYYAEGKDGVIHAIVVLHQLSPENGYQVKFSLEFPGAPSGTIEALNLHALKHLVGKEPDVKQVTFGTGALDHLEGGRNLGKTKVKALKKAYDTINKNLHLTNKSEFREKLGAKNTPVYVCYPKGGLGAGGIRAIMGFLEENQ
ncbi:aspartyl-tRNA synthetase-like protein [Xylogone sp. PMI_703]|nr:aspartyl-tRNA synthetase-like protein [Xylogone sp. PMI_703]